MIKAVLFDFDETLQDRTAAFEKYMDTFFGDFFPGLDLNSEEIKEKKNDMRVTGNGGYVNRIEWYRGLLEKWGCVDTLKPEVLASHYDDRFGDHNAVFPDSFVLLKELKALKIKTGVITNGPSKLQNHKMDESGLRPLCDIVVVSGDLGVHKPQPEIFVYTAEKLGVKPEECVYVGDHPVNDIQGALSAGMKAIRMNWGWFKDCDLRKDVPTVENIINVLSYVKGD